MELTEPTESAGPEPDVRRMERPSGAEQWFPRL